MKKFELVDSFGSYHTIPAEWWEINKQGVILFYISKKEVDILEREIIAAYSDWKYVKEYENL